MSKAEYTPGPWCYEHNSASDEKTFCMSVGPSLGEFGYRGDICYIQSTGHIDGGISTHESEQNARLIAAAPELLEACRRLKMSRLLFLLKIGGSADNLARHWKKHALPSLKH